MSEEEELSLGELLERRRTKKEPSESDRARSSPHRSGGRKLGKTQPTRAAEESRTKKGRPREASSKHPPRIGVAQSIALPVGQKRKYQPRDPRFEDTAGTLDTRKFEANFRFLKDAHIAELERLEAAKHAGERLRGEDLKLYQQLRKKVAKIKREDKFEEVQRLRLQKEREAVRMGKSPYYLNKKRQREQRRQDRLSVIEEEKGTLGLAKEQAARERKKKKRAPTAKRRGN